MTEVAASVHHKYPNDQKSPFGPEIPIDAPPRDTGTIIHDGLAPTTISTRRHTPSAELTWSAIWARRSSTTTLPSGRLC
jgi:hypothetical protein